MSNATKKDALEAAQDRMYENPWGSLSALATINPGADLNTAISELFGKLPEDWEPIDPWVDTTESSTIVYGPYAAVYNGEDIDFVVVYRRRLVQFEDGTVGPIPEIRPVNTTTERNVNVSGATLFDGCKGTGLHCDPDFNQYFEIYDVSDVAEADISVEKNIFEFEQSFLNFTFSYGDDGGGELAPETLSTAPCEYGGVRSISKL